MHWLPQGHLWGTIPAQSTAWQGPQPLQQLAWTWKCPCLSRAHSSASSGCCMQPEQAFEARWLMLVNIVQSLGSVPAVVMTEVVPDKGHCLSSHRWNHWLCPLSVHLAAVCNQKVVNTEAHVSADHLWQRMSRNCQTCKHSLPAMHSKSVMPMLQEGQVPI